MADNQILIKAGFDLAELDKQMKTFVSKFRTALNNSLQNLKIDLTKLKFQNIQLKVTLDTSVAQTQLDNLRKGAMKPIQLPVVLVNQQQPVQQGPQMVPHGPAKPSPSQLAQAAANARNQATNYANPAYFVTQQQIDGLRQTLDAYIVRLKARGATEKEITEITKEQTRAVKQLQGVLDRTTSRDKAYGLTNPGLVRSRGTREEQALTLAGVKAGELAQNFSTLSAAQAQTVLEGKRVTDFMDSFGFKVGILGFGLGILGGYFDRLAQSMIAFYTAGAKAVEPLERLQGLLAQDDSLNASDRSFIFNEINRLADLPGASLDQTAKTFRSLRTLNLEMADTIALVEGLTKATARSGIGAEGMDRIAVQLRDFASTGVLKTQELRSIISAGGRDVSNIITSIAGDTTAASVNRIGFDKFMPLFIQGLKDIPAPTEAAADKINRLTNSFTRMRLQIMEILSPGMDTLLSLMKSLETIVTSLTKAFKGLSESQQTFISQLLILGPIILTGLAAILTGLAAVGIALATVKHAADGLLITKIQLFKLIGQGSTQLGLFAGIFAKLSATIKTAATNLSALVMAARLMGRASIVPLLGRVSVALVRIAGLTTPVGIVLNLILAFLTNLGNFRDILLGSFQSLQRPVGRLIELFKSEKFKPVLSVFSTILSVVEEIIGLLAGTAANILAAIVVQLADIVTLLVDGLEFLRNPNTTTLKAFGVSLVNALISPIKSLGLLMAASFVEGMENLLPSGVKVTGVTYSPATGILPTFGPSTGESLSTRLRNTAFGITPESRNAEITRQKQSEFETLSAKWAESLRKAAEEANKFASEFDKLSDSLAANNLKLGENLRKFVADLAQARSSREFQRLVATDVAAAQRRLAGFVSETEARTLGNVSANRTDSLREAARQNQRALVALGRASAQPEGGMPAGFKKNIGDVKKMFEALNKEAAGASPNLTNINNLLEGITRTVESARLELESGDFLTQPDKYTEQLKSIREELDLVATGAQKYREILNQSSQQEQQARLDSIQQMEEQQELLNERVRSLGAESSAQLIRQKLDKQRQALQTNEFLLEEARLNTLFDVLAYEKNSEEIKKHIIDLEKELADVLNSNNDQLETKRIENQAALKATQLEKDLELEKLKISRQLAQSNRQIFRDSLSTLQELIDKTIELKNIQFPGSGLLPSILGLTEAKGVLDSVQLKRDIDEFFNSIHTITGGSVGRLRAVIGEFEKTLSAIVYGPSDNLTAPLDALLTTLVYDTSDPNSFEKTYEKLLEYIYSRLPTLNEEIEKQRIKVQALTYTLGPHNAETIKAAEEYTVLTDRAAGLGKFIELLNKAQETRIKLLTQESEKIQIVLRAKQQELDLARQALQLETELLETKARVARLADQRSLPTARGVMRQSREEALSAELRAIRLQTEARSVDLALQKEQKIEEAKKANLDSDKIEKIKEYYDYLIKVNEQLGILTQEETAGNEQAKSKWEILREDLEATYGAARKVRTEMKGLFDTLLSGELVLDAFQKWMDGTGSVMDVFAEIGKTTFAAFGQAFADAVAQVIIEGGNFITAFAALLGDVLINLGKMLLSMAVQIPILTFINALADGDTLWEALVQMGASLPFALAAAAGGVALIAAGAAMGGGGGASRSSSTNVSNSANTRTGAVGSDFDPNRDPRTVFQKALMAQISIDIRTDDTQIVKTVIKHVNQNSRLTKLIGNRKLQLGY